MEIFIKHLTFFFNKSYYCYFFNHRKYSYYKNIKDALFTFRINKFLNAHFYIQKYSVLLLTIELFVIQLEYNIITQFKFFDKYLNERFIFYRTIVNKKNKLNIFVSHISY